MTSQAGRAAFSSFENFDFLRHSCFVIPLVHPLAAVGNEDWQFFHHELGFANGANHVYAGRGVPFLRHFLTGMTAPALRVGVASKNAPIECSNPTIMQPRFASSIK